MPRQDQGARESLQDEEYLREEPKLGVWGRSFGSRKPTYVKLHGTTLQTEIDRQRRGIEQGGWRTDTSNGR